MATVLLDSSVIFDALNARRNRREYLREIILGGNALACCPVNITEVYAGLRDHEAAATGQFLRSLQFFPITVEVAQTAGLLMREWRQRGVTLSFSDVTISAVALTNHLALLTDNAKDFPMPELNLYPLPPG